MAPNKDSTGPPIRSPSLSPHPDYWFKGADLYLLLGHTLYRVHSHFFIRESRWWKHLLAGPTSPGDEPLLVGASSTNAYRLTERPLDFDWLLWVFYNSKYGDYSRANLKSWITILRYATRWEFDEVKELAIRYIASLDMDVIERIVLYQENRLPEKYLFPLYMQIASREGMLGLDESRALGYETLVLIHHARERLRAPTPMNNKLLSPIRTDLKSTDVIDIVASTFNISLTNANSNTGNPVPNQVLTRQGDEEEVEGPSGVPRLDLPRPAAGNEEVQSNVDSDVDGVGDDCDEDWDLGDSGVDDLDSAWDDAWKDSIDF